MAMKIAEQAKRFVNHKAGESYCLHGNPICTCRDGILHFNWCGWYTKTTANHMNHILAAIDYPYRVSYAAARDKNEETFWIRIEPK